MREELRLSREEAVALGKLLSLEHALYAIDDNPTINIATRRMKRSVTDRIQQILSKGEENA